MDMILLEQHWIAYIAIAIMIGTLVFAYLKKITMTYMLIIANLIVFFITFIFQAEIIGGVIGDVQYVGLGFRPVYLSFEYLPNIYTLFTSMFVHGGIAHIFGNMLVFFFMGIAFEQRIGWKKFLIIYLVTGVCGALTHSIFNLNSSITLVGASGAIFGILGAFAYSYPRDEVVMPIPLGFFMILRKIKVIYAALLFAALETIFVYIDYGGSTAHLAHIGGLIGGIVLAAVLIGNKGISSERSQQTVYYDSYGPQKPKKINFSSLRKLATTPELKEQLKSIENETVPQVRDVWLEHFLEKTSCPKCGKTLNHFNKQIWCDDCGFKTSY
jgi:membrane associated rhomboid family serine protease